MISSEAQGRDEVKEKHSPVCRDGRAGDCYVNKNDVRTEFSCL